MNLRHGLMGKVRQSRLKDLRKSIEHKNNSSKLSYQVELSAADMDDTQESIEDKVELVIVETEEDEFTLDEELATEAVYGAPLGMSIEIIEKPNKKKKKKPVKKKTKKTKKSKSIVAS